MTVSTFYKFKMADSRAILKIVFGYMYSSTTYCQINAKFGTKKQNHAQSDTEAKIPNFTN